VGSPPADPLPGFETAALTHPGTRGHENQDAHLPGSPAGIWAVADGMGGHHDGGLASRSLVDALCIIPRQASAALLLRACEAAVLQINEHLARTAAERGATIGTTLAALLVHDSDFACIWAGDSRIYRIGPERVERISHDHTEVQDLVDQGVISEQERQRSPRRNVITRAIGVSDHVELEMSQGLLAAGDTFLLCSDGLTNHVGDHELGPAVSAPTLAGACQALVDLALARGGGDNITVVVARYHGPVGAASDDVTRLLHPEA
jgi:serine/threonine protein phosphatase PrpC